MLLKPALVPHDFVADLEFTEAHEFSPAVRLPKVDVLPLPRADFPVTIHCFDDNSGNSIGDTDGRLTPGEAVDVEVRIANNMGETLEDLFATLSLTESYRDLKVTIRKVKFEEIADGEQASIRLTISTNRRTPIGTAKLVATVETESGRVLSMIPFELDVEAP